MQLGIFRVTCFRLIDDSGRIEASNVPALIAADESQQRQAHFLCGP
jgi:hypothetical protein